MTNVDLRLVSIAWHLDRLRWVPTDVLADIVHRDGACLDIVEDRQPPGHNEDLSDRDLAAALCSHCSVRDECLELDLRTAGDDTVGVWGGLSDHDRRLVHWFWLQRGERAHHHDDEGVQE